MTGRARSVVSALFDNRLGKAAAGIIVTSGLLLALNGVAAAYLSETGHVSHTGGTGRASPAAIKAITISTGTITGPLYPGATGDVQVTITNPYNPQSLTITGVSLGTIQVSGASGTCNTTGIVAATPTSITPSATVSGGAQSTVILHGAVTMTSSSDSGCQGASFTVPVSVVTKVG